MFAKLKDFANRRPRLAQWIFLAIGMVIILLATSWDVQGLTLGNRAFLIAATIALAGLCVWIINWDTGEDDEEEPTGAAKDAATGGKTQKQSAK